MFTADSQFGIITTSEVIQSTQEAITLMDRQGVSQLWLDCNSTVISGTSFTEFYCTYDGKHSTPFNQKHE
jgi:hypothetical protein